jgi:hypothetical protein
MKGAYNTILSARGTINYHVSVSAPARRSRAPRGPIAFVAFVATASLLAAAAVTSSSGTVVVPAPLPPRGVAVVFGGGRGGVVVVVVICVRAPHVVKETPGFFVVRMGKDDMPSPTTTRHVLPLW